MNSLAQIYQDQLTDRNHFFADYAQRFYWITEKSLELQADLYLSAGQPIVVPVFLNWPLRPTDDYRSKINEGSGHNYEYGLFFRPIYATIMLVANSCIF